MTDRNEFIVCADLEEISWKVTVKFVALANDTIKKRGVFRVALAGGRTPEAFYKLLANNEFRDRLDWTAVHFFWGDERCVPPEHEDSNYKMTLNSLIKHIRIPEENVHRIKGEEASEKAAAEYEEEIRHCFEPGEEAIPEFDLILLGMGADGHIASLFPGTHAIREDKKLVVAVYVEKLGATRITLTQPVIKNARNIIFLITGEDKSVTFRKVLSGEYMPNTFPAQIARSTKGNVLWFLDFFPGLVG